MNAFFASWIRLDGSHSIETINEQLKSISPIEHTRHRSPLNFLVNLVAGLIAYYLQPKKQSLNIEHLA
jgi:hypothetical protein